MNVYYFHFILMATQLPLLFKRRPYHDYSKVEDQIPAVLQRLRVTTRGDLAKVSKETGIPYSTISRWHYGLMHDVHFNPLAKKWGQHKRIFTDEEEDAIADYIVSNYILPGLHFTDDDFIEIALQAHKEKYNQYLESEDPEERKKYKEFHCSRGFIADFKYHHGFSSKVFHLKRRSEPNDEIQRKFLEEMRNLFKEVDLELIINCDETGWKLFPKGILTWGETGVDNVTRLSTINDKSQVTVLASITAAGTKLPLLFVAQEKTSQVEASQIGDVDYHWKCHSESGWMTDDVFKFYLMKLREHLGHDKTIHLVMDLYPAHMTDEVYSLAEQLNFKLHIIPAGMTDVYQPLDRMVFGALKSKARKYFRLRNHRGDPLKATKADACQDMCSAWESVSLYLVTHAWSIYVEDEDVSPEKKERDALMAHHRNIVKQIREESIRKRVETRRSYLEDDGYKPWEL